MVTRGGWTTKEGDVGSHGDCTYLSDAVIVLVANRFTGDELIRIWSEALDDRNGSLADAYAAAIAEKCVREEVDVGVVQG